LAIPDELEESIGGLNWAVQQNANRINQIIELLREEEEDE
jgi:hypothetical protein